VEILRWETIQESTTKRISEGSKEESKAILKKLLKLLAKRRKRRQRKSHKCQKNC